MSAWSDGIKDANEVIDEWHEHYKKLHKEATDKHNKAAFFLCVRAIENVKESLNKLDPPKCWDWKYQKEK